MDGRTEPGLADYQALGFSPCCTFSVAVLGVGSQEALRNIIPGVVEAAWLPWLVLVYSGYLKRSDISFFSRDPYRFSGLGTISPNLFILTKLGIHNDQRIRHRYSHLPTPPIRALEPAPRAVETLMILQFSLGLPDLLQLLQN